MKKIIFAAALAALSLAPASVEAKGCIKGAVAGAVAGHYMGHHAVKGALAGCVAGHYAAKAMDAHKAAVTKQVAAH
jgi:uncharacterized protein YcfJ